MSVTDENNVECPLCMEPLELDDINFFPCTCGYQICRFCWHRIRTDENGLCPACRKQYPEDPADFKPLTQEEIQRIKNEKRQKDMQRKQKISENRKHLGNVRVVQKNLVFVVGLSQRLADHDVLKRHEYFGKFGKIHKVVINHTTSYAGSQGPSASAYVTYFRVEDALRAISAVNNIHVDGRTLKVSLGTTKYCSHFLKSQQCPKPECMYLHELGDDAASFTKEEMQQGKHQEYEKKLHEQLFHNGRRQTASPTCVQQPTNGPKESWPSLQVTNHATPAPNPKTEGKSNAKSQAKGEKQPRNKSSEDHRSKRSKDKQRGHNRREPSVPNGPRSSDSASSPSPASSGSLGCDGVAQVHNGALSPYNDSSNSTEAEPDSYGPTSSEFVPISDDCDSPPFGVPRTRTPEDSTLTDNVPEEDVDVCQRPMAGGDAEGPTLNGRTYGSVPNEVPYLASDGPEFPVAGRSVPSSFTSPLDWLGNCDGETEAEPLGQGHDNWHPALGLGSEVPMKDDLGFDPWDESSKALADLIETESRCERVGMDYGPPQPMRVPLRSESPACHLHMHMQMGMQQQPQQHHHMNRNVEPLQRYLVPHRGNGARLGAPPGFAPNHMHNFNVNVGVGALAQRPNVLQQVMSNGPNHVYSDAYVNHLSKEIRANSRKGHDAYSIKEWEDGLRALLPNVNISFGTPGYHPQAIPPSHINMQKEKSLGLSNLGWSPPRSEASWMSQDPAILSSGSVTEANMFLDTLRPLPTAAGQRSSMTDSSSSANWMKSYRRLDDVEPPPVMYNNHRFPFSSHLPQTTATWPTPSASQTPPPGFSNSLRTDSKATNSLQLTENLL